MLLFACYHEIAQVVADIAAYGVEMGQHVGQFFVLLGHLSVQVVEHNAGHLAVQLAQAVAQLTLPARGMGQHLLQRLLHDLDVGLHALLVFLRQLLELFGREHGALFERGKGQPRRGAQQRQVAPLGLFLQLHQAGLLHLLELAFDGAAPRLVFLALEGRRKRRLHVLHQPLQVAAELAAQPAGQAQHLGAVGLVEVVDIAPVGRRRFAGRALLHGVVHQGELAHARRSQGKNVVAGTLHLHAKADGADGPLLADRDRQLCKVGGCDKVKQVGVCAAAQQCGRQRLAGSRSGRRQGGCVQAALLTL